MCGICGFNWNDKALVERMNKTLKHRGPDAAGAFADESVSLGQARLSIIDLSPGGMQPMFYGKKIGACSSAHNAHLIEKAEAGITFNGEIYNYQELRDELVKKGFVFSTRSDTEVILASYLAWGVGCVNKFNGMWAFALYDRKRKILFCSRDRAGKKPFYYYHEGRKFVFASELKAIHEQGVPKKIRSDAIDIYLTTGFIPSPMSVFENIYKLEARQNLILDLKTSKVRKYYYFDIPRYNPLYDEKELVREGRGLLRDATRIRLISDVPVGAFLSGGLDSSSVVASMAEFTDLKKLHTFSIGFDGKYDESKYMKCVKDYLKTKHHHEYYKRKSFDGMLDRISYYYDEPFGDYSNFPTYEVSKMAREYVTVSLSGDGGDEIFGGYTMHQAGARVAALKRMPAIARKLFYRLLPGGFGLLGMAREAFRLSLLNPEDFYAELGGELVYKPEAYKQWSREKMREALKSCKYDLAEAVIRYDLYYNTLADNFLVKVDRAAMANSLEARCPFLDYRFMELEAKIPVKYKVSLFKTKILMRKMIAGLVPKKIINRGKQGFTPPIGEWITEGGMSKELKAGLEAFKKKGVLSNEWVEFYSKKALIEDNQVFRNYRIRLLLLMKWWNAWMQGKN